MSNKKRNIHSSGPLGMLLQKGQVHRVEELKNNANMQNDAQRPKSSLYFQTSAGIQFNENELMYVDPKECEPWKYANRRDKEIGNLEKLMDSIKTNQQLQPAVVRMHPNPKSGKKFEIVCGRRRHMACFHLNIPFLVICKHIPNDQDAVLLQDAENKFREDVGNYSNAILYQSLLNDGVFKSERELAKKLKMPHNSLNNLLSLSRIPPEIMDSIENPNALSKNMAIQILSLIANSDNTILIRLKELAPHIGQTITSPTKLIQALENKGKLKNNKKQKTNNAKQYKCSLGKKLFSFKYDRRGLPTIVFDKRISRKLDLNYICKIIQQTIEGSKTCSDIRMIN
jgi:ParB family chromosome partitioning protein